MSRRFDIQRLRNALSDLRIEWQRHALERMVERGIRRSEALCVLLSGELIEDYPEDWPFPSGLFLGWVESRPLHVVAAFNTEGDRAFIVTVYEPDLDHFEADFKTRKTT